MVGGLTYTDLLLIIFIYVAVAALGVALYPKLRGSDSEPKFSMPKKPSAIPKAVTAQFKQQRKKNGDSFYSELFSKPESQVARELGLQSTHKPKAKKNFKKKKDKVNHNKA